jgi:signal transduction histidine kinase
MASVQTRLALALTIIFLLTGAALGALLAGSLLAGGILAGLLGLVSAAMMVAAWKHCLAATSGVRTVEHEIVSIQRDLSTARSHIHIVLDAFPHPVLLISSGGVIDLANPAAAQLGLTVGASLASLPPWVREAVAGNGVPSAGATPREAEPVRVSAAGGERLFTSRVIPVKGGAGDPGVVVFLTDVTDARAAGEARLRLLSTLSHDLKTPMTSIQMSIHLLLEDAAAKLSTRQLEFLQAARDDAHRLHSLIEELVGAARSRF